MMDRRRETMDDGPLSIVHRLSSVHNLVLNPVTQIFGRNMGEILVPENNRRFVIAGGHAVEFYDNEFVWVLLTQARNGAKEVAIPAYADRTVGESY